MDIAFRPWAKCWTFPRRKNAAHGSRKKKNLITSLKLCLRMKCGIILPMKLTNMQKQGLQKDVSKNKYLLFYIFLFFHNFVLFNTHFFHDSLKESGSTSSTTPNCLCRSLPRAVHNLTGMVDGLASGLILSWFIHIRAMSLCQAWPSMLSCN